MIHASRRTSLLIIDDDLDILKFLDTILSAAGFDSRIAISAADGLKEIAQSLPDAVICDLHMPGMSGLDFLRQLRALPHLESLSVGIVTGDIGVPDEILEAIGQLDGSIRVGVLPREDLIQFALELTSQPRQLAGGGESPSG